MSNEPLKVTNFYLAHNHISKTCNVKDKLKDKSHPTAEVGLTRMQKALWNYLKEHKKVNKKI